MAFGLSIFTDAALEREQELAQQKLKARTQCIDDVSPQIAKILDATDLEALRTNVGIQLRAHAQKMASEEVIVLQEFFDLDEAYGSTASPEKISSRDCLKRFVTYGERFDLVLQSLEKLKETGSLRSLEWRDLAPIVPGISDTSNKSYHLGNSINGKLDLSKDGELVNIFTFNVPIDQIPGIDQLQQIDTIVEQAVKTLKLDEKLLESGRQQQGFGVPIPHF